MQIKTMNSRTRRLMQMCQTSSTSANSSKNGEECYSTDSDSITDINDYSSDEYVLCKNKIDSYSFNSDSDDSISVEINEIDNINTEIQSDAYSEKCTVNIETNYSVIQSCSASTNISQKKRGRQKQEGPKTRKRLSNPKTWGRNIEKSKKTKGEEYVNTKGQLVAKNTLQPPCSCRLKCSEKFTHEQRENIFKNFYNLPKDSQMQFIASSVIETNKKLERLRNDE
ncbi:uncharacterized protein LOC126901948 [Daktulosphaira vitifoliae]|uniref:uncharacterized protein LOC126901948 n=1 Tax=Daktulosphaira vitifoliae TaxID=58002 RepID=UPI0021A998D3|nr:uncharacterized protein LOC126901948 [Daktulosphaira vitifoliae]